MKKIAGKLIRFLFRCLLWFIGISVTLVIIFRWAPVPYTPLMFIRAVEQKENGKPVRMKKDWVPLEEISPHLQLAVVCTEDQNFIRHWGFDREAIEKALEHNKTHKNKRGASTISQQVAKNLFLWPSRSWVRKGFEVYFTFLIEVFWSKERIMEVYLNIVELGDGIYGAEAASQEFFKKNASSLSKEQAALLASILPNPLEYSVKRPGPYILERQAWTLNQMRLWGGKLDYHPEEKEK